MRPADDVSETEGLVGAVERAGDLGAQAILCAAEVLADEAR